MKVTRLDWDATKENQKGFQPNSTRYLHVTPTYQAHQVKYREVLALLSAVAHVDLAGWKYVMKNFCGESVEKISELPCYLLHLGDNVQAELIDLCGVSQRSYVTEEYQTAMAMIASLDTRTSRLHNGTTGEDVQVPVRVKFDSQHRNLSLLHSIHAAETAIRKEWTDYEENTDTLAGSLRCTFVMEPMVADLTETRGDFREISTTLVHLIQENVWFSHLTVPIRSGKKSAMQFRQLMTALFDTTRRNPNQANTRYYCGETKRSTLQIGVLHLRVSDISNMEVEAMCSAMAFCQTTRSLRMEFPLNISSSGPIWRFLAYGVFSKTSRQYSSIGALTLSGIGSMNSCSLQKFALVASSLHPEEDLCEYDRHRMDEKIATIKANAPLYRRSGVTTQTFPGGKDAGAMTFCSRIFPVRTFDDNGNSLWMNALVPGLGSCLVQRSDVLFDGGTGNAEDSSGCDLVSLKLIFPSRAIGANDFSGMTLFLDAIGPSLKFFTLDAPVLNLEYNTILKHCPNLHTLRRAWGSNILCFDFHEFHAKRQPLPQFHFQYDDFSAITAALGDVNSLIAKCVRLLRIHLNPHSHGRNNDGILNTLLSMLTNNRILEHLEVIVPPAYLSYRDRFNAHHKKVIGQAPAPMKVKLSLLSGMQSTHLLPNSPMRKKTRGDTSKLNVARCGFDRFVVSNILEFAASPVVRKVYLRAQQQGYS